MDGLIISCWFGDELPANPSDEARSTSVAVFLFRVQSKNFFDDEDVVCFAAESFVLYAFTVYTSVLSVV